MTDHFDPIEPLATAVADGSAIDWNAAAATPSPAPVIDQLRAVASLRPTTAPGLARWRSTDIDVFTHRVLLTVMVLSLAKLALALAGIPYAPTFREGAYVPVIVHTAYLIMFGGAGLALLAGGYRDGRARTLGCTYLLLATSGDERYIIALAQAVATSLVPAARALTQALATEAFAPVFFLVFAARFPTMQYRTRSQRVIINLRHATFAAAIALTLLNVMLAWSGAPSSWRTALARFDHTHTADFWSMVMVFWAAAVPLVLWKSRAASPLERRRANLLVGSLGVGLAPTLFFAWARGPFSPFGPRYFRFETLHVFATFVQYPFLLSIPLTTAYAVLVERVLDVRLVLGRALRYALTRSVVLVTTVAPLITLLVLAWTHRGDVVGASAGHSAMLLLLMATGVAGWFLSPRLLMLVDRLFQREHHDARVVLAGFTAEARAALGVRDVAATVRAHLARAFHPEDAAVLVRSRDGRSLVAVAGRAPDLVVESGLAAVLGAGTTPVVLAPGARDPLFLLLSPAERAWLLDTGFTVLIPLPASDGDLIGALALCDRRGGAPYTDEDLLLASALASAAAVTLEHRRLREAGPPLALPDAAPAAECRLCGLVHAGDTAVCHCGTAVVGARTPLLLAGKFRVERRLGTGAMGVVYTATDTALDRRVAVKALPRLTPVQAARLRTEARAMARVAHPNLAMIFALETWRGIPLLIVEHFDGGTLAQRLVPGPIAPTRALWIGTRLADAVARMHAAGLVHGDIKPSNVGFTLDGIPKLIDFGLARLQVDDTEADLDLTGPRPGGTPLYLPPEVLAGAPVDPSADLWGLNLVLYEAVAGGHPFRRATPGQTLVAIRRGTVPDLRTLRPAAPPVLAEYLGRALARDRARRPGSAVKMGAELATILAMIE